jgi:hypothetical protein
MSNGDARASRQYQQQQNNRQQPWKWKWKQEEISEMIFLVTEESGLHPWTDRTVGSAQPNVRAFTRHNCPRGIHGSDLPRT